MKLPYRSSLQFSTPGCVRFYLRSSLSPKQKMGIQYLTRCGSFRKLGVPYLGVPIRRILLPYFRKLPCLHNLAMEAVCCWRCSKQRDLDARFDRTTLTAELSSHPEISPNLFSSGPQTCPQNRHMAKHSPQPLFKRDFKLGF